MMTEDVPLGKNFIVLWSIFSGRHSSVYPSASLVPCSYLRHKFSDSVLSFFSKQESQLQYYKITVLQKKLITN